MSRAKTLTKFVLVHGKDNTQAWRPVNIADKEHIKFFEDDADKYDYEKHFKQIGDDPEAIFVPFDEPVDDFNDEELENPDIQELIDAMENDDYVVNDDNFLNEENLDKIDDLFVNELVQDINGNERKDRPIDTDFDMFMSEYEERNNEDADRSNGMSMYGDIIKSRDLYTQYEYDPTLLKDRILDIVNVQSSDEEISDANSENYSEEEEAWNCDLQQMANADTSVRPSVIELPRGISSRQASKVETVEADVIEVLVPKRKKDETKEEKKSRKEQQKKANQLRRERRRGNK